MSIHQAIKELRRTLKKDDGYYQSWQSNIAMAYMDAEAWHRARTKKKYLNHQDKHSIANEAADYFLANLMGGPRKVQPKKRRKGVRG
jgi:hypothetical protein